MAVSRSANITALASDYMTFEWSCSLPVLVVGIRYAGESEWTQIFNNNQSQGYLDIYKGKYTLTPLESNTEYTLEIKIIEVNATKPDYDTPDVVLNFKTVEEVNMAASIDTVMVNANTLRVLWNTNMGVADAYYKVNGEEPGIGIEFPSGATSGTVYITDIAVGDFIEFYFIGEALNQNIIIKYYITETNIIPTPDDNPVPDIDVDLNKIVFPYIYEDFTKKPKDLLTSRDWNAAISLLIYQGNYIAKALNMLGIANYKPCNCDNAGESTTPDDVVDLRPEEEV